MNTGTSAALARQWSRSSLSFIGLLAFLLHCEAAAPKATPLKNPKRVVSGQTVDLTPLFHWWTNHHGDRPLSAWVHVSGTVSSKNGWGWVISGQAENSKAQAGEPGARASTRAGTHQFLLKNPPTQEAAEFEGLREELNQANEERARLQSEAAKAKSQESHDAASRRSRGRATAQLHRIEQADNAAAKSLDQKINDLKKRLAVFPSPDHYQIDAIALDTGTENNHLLVFDYGMVLN